MRDTPAEQIQTTEKQKIFIVSNNFMLLGVQQRSVRILNREEERRLKTRRERKRRVKCQNTNCAKGNLQEEKTRS